MFFTNFGMDMYRWSNANGMDMSEEGRQYAPWPIKSAKSAAMESNEIEKVFMIAACVSATIAFTDLIIVQIKRHRARKKAEALPGGTIIINRKPLFEEASTDQDSNAAGEADLITPEQPIPQEP